jgi:hypothetical protein
VDGNFDAAFEDPEGLVALRAFAKDEFAFAEGFFAHTQ